MRRTQVHAYYCTEAAQEYLGEMQQCMYSLSGGIKQYKQLCALYSPE